VILDTVLLCAMIVTKPEGGFVALSGREKTLEFADVELAVIKALYIGWPRISHRSAWHVR
jgi:hypothetical protein